MLNDHLYLGCASIDNLIDLARNYEGSMKGSNKSIVELNALWIVIGHYESKEDV